MAETPRQPFSLENEVRNLVDAIDKWDIASKIIGTRISNVWPHLHAAVSSAAVFAEITSRARQLANDRGGDYGSLSHAELCGFMVEYDGALNKVVGGVDG